MKKHILSVGIQLSTFLLISAFAFGQSSTLIESNGNNGILSKNSSTVLDDPGIVSIPASGSGTRLMWIPAKSAFRVGTVNGNVWDDSNIGTWSFASGTSTHASGKASTAMGIRSSASGDYSTAIGFDTQATGLVAIAMGWQTHAGNRYSFSSGFNTYASGYYSTAMGNYTIARGASTLAIGQFNDPISSSEENISTPTTPFFIIGNGTSETVRNNAFVVLKNGNTSISGFTKLGEETEVPKIKMKKLTGISQATQGTWTNVAHNLTQSKILSVNIIMSIPSFVNLPPNYTFQAGYEYQYQISSTNIVVINTTTNSANILSKNFTILITYEE